MTIQFLNVSPAFGTAIQPGQALQFSVRTEVANPFTEVLVAVEFEAIQGMRELVFAGDPATVSGSTALPRYAASFATDLTDPGFQTVQYTVNVNGNWPASPRLYVYAANTIADTIDVVAPQGDWLLERVSPVSPFQPLPPNPPLVGSVVQCFAEAFDQDHFLDTLQNSYPEDYFESIKAGKDGGFELFQAAAKVAERVSLAIARLECCGFIFTALGGLKSTGQVEFFRDSAADGPITIEPGTVLRGDGGRDFLTTTVVEFDGVELGPKVAAIEAIATGYQYNLPGQITTAGDEVLEGSINTILKVVTDPTIPAAIDRNMQVRQPAPTVDGRSACLDALGEDLDIPRLADETDAEYRVRILEVPDTVSPNAICRGVDKILSVFGAECCLREIGAPLFPGFYYDAGSSSDSPQDPATNFAYDFDFTVRPQDRFKLLMSHLESRAFFLLGVPTITRISYGMFYDGDSADPFPLQNAYDTEPTDAFQNPNDVAYDGEAILDALVYQSIYDVTNRKRAGGVGFDLYIEDIGCV